LLLCLAVKPEEPQAVGDIEFIAAQAGLGAAKNWNISGLLSASSGAIRLPAGWKLTSPGKARVKEITGQRDRRGPESRRHVAQHAAEDQG